MMNSTMLGVALFICILATFSSAIPLYEDDLQAYHPYDQYQPQEQYLAYANDIQLVRRARSPNGEIDVHAQHTTQQGGSATAQYNHRLWQNGGAHLDANAYYQRNWGNVPGPRKDYGGGLTMTVPLGRH